MTRLLLQHSRARVSAAQLASACAASDIVVSERALPPACHPHWFKADRGLLERTGGLTVDLVNRRATTVSSGQGRHGWERRINPADDDPGSAPFASAQL